MRFWLRGIAKTLRKPESCKTLQGAGSLGMHQAMQDASSADITQYTSLGKHYKSCDYLLVYVVHVSIVDVTI